MKKKLEADLISIAHRILKLRSNAELAQLQKETLSLYEKLSVLVFVEEHFADAKPTIGKAKAEEVIEDAFEKEPESAPAAEPVSQVAEVAAEPETAPETPSESDPKPDEEEKVAEEQVQEPEQPEEEKLEPESIPEPVETPTEKEVDEVIAEAEESAEQSPTEAEIPEENEAPAEENTVEATSTDEPEAPKEDDMFKPAFEWAFEPKSEEKSEQAIPDAKASEPTASGQIAFEDLLGAGYVDPVFVKPEDSSKPAESLTSAQSEPKADVIPISRRDDKVPVFKINNDNVSLNDRLAKGSITVGLNDRIAFVKNLFNNSNEEYNRVLSQLLTFDTYSEAEEFINTMVKPDYNNWEGKDDFALRFMEVVEKKFS
ncbi:MAG: hypothetical protein EOO48_09800 [Flavobacterium sp.]|nr:MAG: hypothetical protein EOO48_09800 [Flavobacterium sp.]